MSWTVANSRRLLDYSTAATRRRESMPLPVSVRWQPLPGPQTAAWSSAADWIGYGGAGGGGKSDLALGLAVTKHRRSVIFRNVYPSLAGLIDRSREIYNATGDPHAKDSYNEGLHRWRLSSGQYIAFDTVQHDKDREKFRGNPHDLYVFDECTEFSESTVRFITAWNRTSIPGQHCQVLLTFNPPANEESRWVIRFFLPWMAYLYPKLPESAGYRGTPAAPGELRWYTTVDGVDTEVAADTPGARSRTYYPASVDDNPILVDQGYKGVLEALPEPLRSQLRYGDFLAGMGVDAWQVLPTDHVLAAMARWSSNRPAGAVLSGVGVDVARGGNDQTTIARRFGQWYDQLIVYPGSATPSGPITAALVAGHLEGDPTVTIDVIGVGASVYDSLAGGNIRIRACVASSSANGETDRKSGVLGFGNERARLWWRMRESLDPESGDGIALPDDPDLRAELCSAKFFVRSGRIWVESKDDIRKRIGRSTDRADAVIMALEESLPLLLWGGDESDD